MKNLKIFFAIYLLIMCVIPMSSCTKDSDLLLEAILQEEEEAALEKEKSLEEESTDTTTENGEEEETENISEEEIDEEEIDIITDLGNTNKVDGTYYPASASEITDPSRANFKAIITNSFDCSACTFAPNQTIEPAGGIISGNNIDLNEAYIENTFEQAFSSSTTFKIVYDKSKVSPETFGAVSGDGTDDNEAINALINNCSLAIGAQNGSYIKNSPSTYRRSGIFNWDMNGSKVEITSSSNFRMSQVSVDAVFDITTLSPTIYNGEFDGNGVYGRLFYLHGQDHFAFNDLHVHDLYSPNAIRAVAFRFTIDANSSGFRYGEFKRNLIEDIVAQGDSNYNDGGGIAKAWWYTLRGMSSSTTFDVVYDSNVVRNIIGDDAEGFYAIGGANVSHNGSFSFNNEDYRYCTRRAIKACISNVEIKNSYFEEIPQSMFNSAQQMGSMIDFFSTSSGNLIENIRVHDNVIRTVPGNDAHYYLLSLTDAKDVVIESNTITMENLGTYGGIRLGSNTSSYSGALQDITIRNNTLNNTYVQAMSQYAPVGNQPIKIDKNTFNFTSSLGYDVAAFRFYGKNGTHGYVDFLNNDIIVNMSSARGVNGVLTSDGLDVVGFNIDNANITYVNAQAVRPFGYLKGNFNNTNIIKNSTLTGASGSNAIEVSGSQSAQVVNSTDNNGNPITIK